MLKRSFLLVSPAILSALPWWRKSQGPRKRQVPVLQSKFRTCLHTIGLVCLCGAMHWLIWMFDEKGFSLFLIGIPLLFPNRNTEAGPGGAGGRSHRCDSAAVSRLVRTQPQPSIHVEVSRRLWKTTRLRISIVLLLLAAIKIRLIV